MNTEIKDKATLEEIRNNYGSVSKMIAIVENEVQYLIKNRGYEGRDRSETLEVALRQIPTKYHNVFFRYRNTYPRP